jgi:hypothetical protein
MSQKQVFAQISKIDLEKRIVTGVASDETRDNDGEVMDYATSKAHFEAWSSGYATKTDGKSFGNLREMHQLKAAGKIAEPPVFDDATKTIAIKAFVSDDSSWAKVQDGTLTGFSIQGPVIGKKWLDSAKKAMRYTVNPREISLVDAPCNPGATFFAVKADGSEETRELHGNPDSDFIMKTGKKHSAGTMETVGKAKDALASMGDCLTNNCQHTTNGQCSDSIMAQHEAATTALSSLGNAPAEKADAVKAATETQTQTGDEPMDDATKAIIQKAADDSAKAAADAAESLTVSKATNTAIEALIKAMAGESKTDPIVAVKSHSGAGTTVVMKTEDNGGDNNEDALVKAQKATYENADEKQHAIAKAILSKPVLLSRDQMAGLNIGRA